ncbi:hypothetical protein GGF50DRAFT_112373 [Schizophyllum commune]
MSARQRSPSIEIVSFGPPAQPKKTARSESTRIADNQSASRKGASTKGTSAAAVKTIAATSVQKPVQPEKPPLSISAGTKRKSLDAPTSATKRAKTGADAAPKENKAKVEEKKNPAERWKWIDLVRPDIEIKGTKIEAYNCGGAYWKATGKTMADRLDKMERFLAECEGDETCHPRYAEL